MAKQSGRTERVARYGAKGGAVIGRGGERFFNRPLYSANKAAFALAGDRPAVRFASGDTVHGTLRWALRRDGRTRWLHANADVTFAYGGGAATWEVRDDALGVRATVEVVALGERVGFAARVRCRGGRASDELVWVYGGAVRQAGRPVNETCDPHHGAERTATSFAAEACAGNRVTRDAAGAVLWPADAADGGTAVRCSAGGMEEWEVRAWADAAAKKESDAAGGVVLGGCVTLQEAREVTWVFVRVAEGAEKSGVKAPEPGVALAAGLARAKALAARIVAETPEPRLNAAAALLGAALDGLWYPPVFVHGAMLWNYRLPGWRTVFGGTVAGWHERVRAQAEFYCAKQVTRSALRSGESDPEFLRTCPAKTSRFYGRGRIEQDQAFYNMQTQFFDQLVHAWRWTGDAKLAAVLRPALERHLEWVRECFDPDDDGVYESVVNVWPTDSVWYAGGGGVEETAYAFRGHAAARDLARQAGDAAAERKHGRQLEKIARGFREKLWIVAKGRAGLYREQGGLERLHEDAWLYGIFLPIDAGMLDAHEAASSLDYAAHELQNDAMPGGGRRVWTSNFVPGIWSVRELWPADNYHLALAYFQTGLSEDGWDVLRGSLWHTAFDSLVPGDFGAPAGGTDFGECVHMAARVLVEGLFGYRPDYPNGVVVVAPQFPAEWKRARVCTADVVLRYARRGGRIELEVELTRAARVEVRLAVSARVVEAVTVNGRAASWRAEPGFGRTVISVAAGRTKRVRVMLRVRGSTAVFAAEEKSVNTGERVTLGVAGAPVLAFEDPQGVLKEAVLRDGRIVARASGNVGVHAVAARVQWGELPQWRRFLLRVANPRAEAAERARQVTRVPARARWRCVDLGAARNGDVRTIFQQEYVSPRPATVSLRIGTDGYSPWTFPHWRSGPPEIALDAVPRLRERGGARRLWTPQGVPFAWSDDEARNIAFTSRWDNWPQAVTVPVGCAGEAVWFLVCGSTNPMQGHIANAVLRLRYADGGEDALELVPPMNYWNLCPIRSGATAPGQADRDDYTAPVDRFCLPKKLPETVQLGKNCRAMLLNRRLRAGVVLESVTLETLSLEVVVGLMGVTVSDRSR